MFLTLLRDRNFEINSILHWCLNLALYSRHSTLVAILLKCIIAIPEHKFSGVSDTYAA